MGYTPTVWQTGDIVTSDRLNKIENGIAGAYNDLFIVKFSYDQATSTIVCNKTFEEIKAKFDSGESDNMVAYAMGVSSCGQITESNGQGQIQRVIFYFWIQTNTDEFSSRFVVITADGISSGETMYILTPVDGN